MESGIVGTWQLYEIGGSTGASFYTTPVPAQPLQALSFTNQGQVHKEGNQLGDYFDYPLYRVDSVQTNYWIRFLANKADTMGYRVGLSIRADTMQLTPFCAEGCYTKFVRIR